MTISNVTHPITQPPLILASASPRRRELLAALGALFTVRATGAEDRDDHAAPPAALVAALAPMPVPIDDHPTVVAWRKATEIDPSAAVVLAADTTVLLDGRIMNKPRDDDEAHAMLSSLSGRTHQVYTGLCVLRPAAGVAPDQAIEFGATWMWATLVESQVEFYRLSDDDIAAYVASGEAHDKAGAYGIQGQAGRFVRAVHGSYTNVVGLPLIDTVRLLAAAGIADLRDPAETYLQWLKRQEKEPLSWPPTHP